MQQKVPVRIVIYAKDVINITGRKERAAWKLLAQIRRKYKKKKGQFIAVKEFSAFTGIEEESIYSYLHNNNTLKTNCDGQLSSKI